MTCFIIHMIFRAEFEDDDSGVLVRESIVQVTATDGDAAHTEACRIGVERDGESVESRCGPARLRFVGVRKIVEVNAIRNGTELTTLDLELDERSDVDALVRGEEMVRAIYEW